MNEHQIHHQDDGKKGRFYIEINGKTVAEMTYVWSGEQKFIIDHTEVDASLNGQGIGRKLVQAAVEKARAEHLKIIPLCPFAKATFAKTSDWHDVLL